MAKKKKIKTDDSREIIQYRIEKNLVSNNEQQIKKLCKKLKIEKYKIIPYEEDMAISVYINAQNFLIICDLDTGYLLRLHKNEKRNSKGKFHYHVDGNEKKIRKFSTFFQALDSCCSTHNPLKMKNGINWIDDLLNKDKKMKFK